MGFPPIGIMSLSSVLKRAGHEVRDVRPGQSRDARTTSSSRRSGGSGRTLVGLSFLSTTSYPTPRSSRARSARPTPDVKIAFGGVFATPQRPARQAAGAGSRLRLPRRRRAAHPRPRSSGSTIPTRSTGVTWQEQDGTLRHNPNRPLERNLDQWPFPDRESLPLDFVESMPLDVPAVLSLERFTTMQTSRGCPWPCVFCDIPIFNEGKWRVAEPRARGRGVRSSCRSDGYGSVYFVDDHFLLQPKRIEAICKGIVEQRHHDPVGLRGPRRLGRAAALPGHGEGALPHDHVRHRERQPEDARPPEEGADARGDRDRGHATPRTPGIEIVHGFFVVGIPDETEEDLRATFRLRVEDPRSTASASTACASIAARRSGRSTSSAAS